MRAGVPELLLQPGDRVLVGGLGADPERVQRRGAEALGFEDRMVGAGQAEEHEDGAEEDGEHRDQHPGLEGDGDVRPEAVLRAVADVDGVVDRVHPPLQRVPAERAEDARYAAVLVAVGALFATLLIGTSWYFYTQHRLLIDFTYPLLSTTSIYLTLIFTSFVREQRQRKQIRTAFAQYMSPTLVEQLAQSPEKLVLGGEEREMTIMFSDVRGFTTISESYKNDPQGLTALMNRFLTPLTNAITNVSGRGVGMDVVQSVLHRLKGTVHIETHPGQGTTFRLKLPLTLAIIPVLIATAADERFAIPQANLLELVGIVPGSIETLHDVPVFRLRDRLLPVVSLARELHLDDGVEESLAGRFLIVLRADERRYGLVVDGLSDPSEIVVKPLGSHLNGLEVFAGATILGDGHVGLILDVVGLADRAGVAGAVHERTLDLERHDEGPRDRRALLVFAGPAGGRMAVPLELVDRLEGFPRAVVERSGMDEAVPYGDRILPLVPLRELLVERRREPRRTGEDMPAELQVLVHRRGDDLVGLVVGRIIDIVEQPPELQAASRPGVSGTMFVQGRITEIIDLPALLDAREDRRRLDVSASSGAAS